MLIALLSTCPVPLSKLYLLHLEQPLVDLLIQCSTNIGRFFFGNQLALEQNTGQILPAVCNFYFVGFF